MHLSAELVATGKNTTGIRVPDDDVAALGRGQESLEAGPQPRRPRRARQAGTAQATPVEWTGQYPFGFLSRYCWWYASA